MFMINWKILFVKNNIEKIFSWDLSEMKKLKNTQLYLAFQRKTTSNYS